MKSQQHRWLLAGMVCVGLSPTGHAFGQASGQIGPSEQVVGQAVVIEPTEPLGTTTSFAESTGGFPRGWQSLGSVSPGPTPQFGTLGASYGLGNGALPGALPVPSGAYAVPGPGTPGGGTGAAAGAPAGGPGAGGMAGADGTTGLPGLAGGSGATGGLGTTPGAGLPEGVLAGLGRETGVGAEAAFAPPNVIGDQGPFPFRIQAFRANIPPIPGPRPPGAGVGSGNLLVNGIVPSIRGFKIADNQSPRPVDRVFATFNYYDNVNKDLNDRLGFPIKNMQVYHQLYGLEKTFLDQNASLGIRVPIDTLSMTSTLPGYSHTSTSFSNLNFFGKYVLWQNSTGSLVSAGLSVTTPTGPAAFAGFPGINAINAVELGPFLGYIFQADRFYWQGFFQVGIPLTHAWPGMLYFDNSFGYFLYRSQNRDALLTSIIPIFEVHTNVPTSHIGYSTTDPYGTPTVVDLTFGGTFGIGRRSYLTMAYVQPVTGPQPFSGEFSLQFNWLFGPSARRAGSGMPPPFSPVIGN